MITVPQATETIINRSRFLSEAMAKGMLNYSAVSRYIKPEIEEMLIKQVSDAAIIMALKRLEKKQLPKQKYQSILTSMPEITVRSNLHCLYCVNSPLLAKYFYELAASNGGTYFFMQTHNAFEIIALLQKELYGQIQKVIADSQIISLFKNVSAITIKLDNHKAATPDVFYFFLKSLAWEGITVQELFSGSSDVTFVFKAEEVNRAFSVLQSLFTTRQTQKINIAA